jgi:hypothetical protein
MENADDRSSRRSGIKDFVTHYSANDFAVYLASGVLPFELTPVDRGIVRLSTTMAAAVRKLGHRISCGEGSTKSNLWSEVSCDAAYLFESVVNTRSDSLRR